MTDILCKWLNEDVRLEPKLDENLAEKFSTGYLFGEILHKYELQSDFHLFSKANTSEAKLNNFTLLEPSFKLLEIPFTVHIAREVMMQNPGLCTRLVYQLYLALTRKKERQLTTQSLECMRPPGKVKLDRMEADIFQRQLKQQTTRQVHIHFEQMVERYKNQHRLYEEKMIQLKKDEEERCMLEKRMFCQKSSKNSRALRKDNSAMYKKLKPLTSRMRAKTSPGAHLPRNTQCLPLNVSVAEETVKSIEQFESTMKKRLSLPVYGDAEMPAAAIATKDVQSANAVTGTTESSADYMQTIHRRVAENCLARARREKRRRSVLVMQMKVIQEQEEAKREKMLVERLMRQSQQEKRIATQLLHIRKEKDTIRKNRILRQQQYSKQREQEYIEELNRSDGLALLEEEERKKRLKHHNELYQKNLAKKAKLNYQANYSICHDIVMQIVDFTTQFAHYRELTKNQVPDKIVQDWKTLFILGRPLYEEDWIDSWPLDYHSSMVTTTSSITMRPLATNDQLLNDTDLQDYINGVNDWSTPRDFSQKFPLQSNPILSHAVHRVLDTVDPPRRPCTPALMPRFTLRACALGKPFTGKTTVLRYLKKAHGLTILSVESITKKAIGAYHDEWLKLQTQYSTPTSNHNDLGEVQLSDDTMNGGRVTPHITVKTHDTKVLTSPSEEVHKEETKIGGHTTGRTSPIEEDFVMAQISDDLMFQLSPLANLGCKAHSSLTNGEALDDALLNDIFIQVILSLPEGSGWILDNYPTTLEQAKLFFASLTGQSRPRPVLSRDFVLLGGSNRDESVLKASSGLDIVLYFDASNDVILQRVSMIATAETQYGNQLEQIQERLMVYSDNWRSIYRWCSRYKIVSTINAMVDIRSVCDIASDRVQEVINNNKQIEAMKKLGFEEDLMASGSVISLSSVSETPMKKRVHPCLFAHHRRTSSAGLTSATGKRLRSASVKTPEFTALVKECEKDPWNPVNLEIVPGAEDWEYYIRPIIKERMESLARKWPAIETTYVDTLKQIFQMIRAEREAICKYFFVRRKQFSAYLGRPDHKQEFVNQWQDHYNSLDLCLHHEDVVKAELHHRVDDLMDQLWDICEQRKIQADEESQRIEEEQWMEDHIGLLSNHYVSIMQVELDKFQDTVFFIKDYYNAMEKKVPEKLPEPGRLFLIKLSVTEPPDPPPSQTSSTHSVTHESVSSEGNERVKEVESPGKDGSRKIPLLPRKHVPDHFFEERIGRRKPGHGFSMTGPSLINVSRVDLDKQLLNHVFNQGIILVYNLMGGEIKILDTVMAECKPSVEKATEPPAPEPKEEPLKRSRGKKPKNQSNGQIKKGGRISAGKKSGRSQVEAEAPPTKPAVVTPDIVMKRHRTLHRCKEYKAALLHEDGHVQTRLDLVRIRCLAMIDELKEKEQAMQKEMESWMIACYEQEVESVGQLADMLRQTIESEKQLLYEITLPGAKFHINKDVITFVPMPSPSPPSPVEHPNLSYFTVAQLRSLHQHLQLTAPSGFILARTLLDTLQGLVRSSSKDASLPFIWRDASKQQLEDIMKMLFGQNVNFVDWRRLLVCVALPWPLPTPHQLVEAWTAMESGADNQSSGKMMVSKKKFMATEIWLDQPLEGQEEEEVVNVGCCYNRKTALKETFVDIFCEENGMLDLRTLLLYLCADPQPKQGLYKALSVVTVTPLSSLQEIDSSVTVLLHDFHQVLTWATHQDTEGIITVAELLDVFVQVDHNNPYEVPLAALLSYNSIATLIEGTENFDLPDFFAVLQTNEGKTEP